MKNKKTTKARGDLKRYINLNKIALGFVVLIFGIVIALAVMGVLDYQYNLKNSANLNI